MPARARRGWTAAGLAAALAACGPGEPARSAVVPGLPAYRGARLESAQPTPAAGGARVERWTLRVPGGDEPARVAEVQGEVLAWYRGAMEEAGFVLQSDGAEPLQLYTNAVGCTAYVSLLVDAAAPDRLLIELGAASDDGACAAEPTPTPSSE